MLARSPWLPMPLDECPVSRPPTCEPPRVEGETTHEGVVLFASTFVPILEPILGLLEILLGIFQDLGDPGQGLFWCQILFGLFVPQVPVVLYQLARLSHPDHA